MVGRLATDVEQLDVASGVLGDAGQHLLEELAGDVAGTTARHQNALRLQETNGQAIDVVVALQGVGHGLGGARELRGIEDHQAEPPGLGRELFEETR